MIHTRIHIHDEEGWEEFLESTAMPDWLEEPESLPREYPFIMIYYYDFIPSEKLQKNNNIHMKVDDFDIVYKSDFERN